MSTKQSKKTDYEQLGRMLQNIYETGYIDHVQSYKHSFIKGLVSGLGGVIGATIVVALLLWLLSVLNHVPLVGPVFQSVRDSVQEKR